MLSILCKTFGHKVNRHRVWHDSMEFRTSCDRCDAPLIRGRDGWRVFDEVEDGDAARRPHPHGKVA